MQSAVIYIYILCINTVIVGTVLWRTIEMKWPSDEWYSGVYSRPLLVFLLSGLFSDGTHYSFSESFIVRLTLLRALEMNRQKSRPPSVLFVICCCIHLEIPPFSIWKGYGLNWRQADDLYFNNVDWGTGVRGESVLNNVLCTVGNRG